MGEFDKTYGAFKLPPRPSEDKKTRPSQPGAGRSQKSSGNGISPQDGVYYEIEYDSTPMPGVGKFVQRTQKVQAPERDEVRELFSRMRDIARSNRVLTFGNSKFYNRKVQQDNARIFYKQGMFMKDFEDDYKDPIPYTEYYPYYQMMGYRQLRTYFTWRTQVRKDQVEETSLSYAYLYIYELLCNIGVSDPQDGLDKLLYFWREFRKCQPSVDKYVLPWLKDYHIYYDLPQSFSEFVRENDLEEQYPELTGSEDRFGLFCSLSRYDIRKSVFYGEGREALIRDCFDFAIDRVAAAFGERGIDFESLIFLPSKSMAVWTPFQDALFYPWRQQRDRRVAISAKEIYECRQNQWTYRTVLTAESGRQLVGYILKQMEAVLRQTVHYKYKITAGMKSLSPATVSLMQDAGISLGQCITDAVAEFYREATKTVVTVNRDALAKIRREALQTQEKLLVPEDGEMTSGLSQTVQVKHTEPEDDNLQRKTMVLPEEHGLQRETAAKSEDPAIQQKAVSLQQDSGLGSGSGSSPVTPVQLFPGSSAADTWNELKMALTETEKEAIRLILQGDPNIKQFADAHGIMLEVLADGINEKAVDAMGDSLLDDGFKIYEEYQEQVSEMLNL